ncbi:ribokinase [Solibaculum mannosilyticum]|uniref:Ribokinase n=2 Tax=Solibaculum mannosilyticum TaxID=2780922 RepID=A0A7I8D1C3_9FIRM|nr:ribokinase [Solibaculum mannosilyticum]MCO7137083.1 ribokinase [[Clostridium] leptum]BCI59492.1 ribokinase [Solibaculum mannosilyticum]CZT55273.1 Ribokinase [Eubacteriaceae bacterium CHKCI005]
MKILNYGSLNIDYVYDVPHFVQPGETIHAPSRTIHCGGKGLNQSVALAKAGAKVYHAGRIGEDGGFLLETLKQEGIDTQFITVSQEPTGHAVIQVDAKGENAIVIYGGANRTITSREIAKVFEHFEAGDMLVLQNEINDLDLIMKTARERGMIVVFNPAPFDGQVLSLPLETVNLFVVNRQEGAALSGCTRAEDIVKGIVQKYPSSAVVLTLGSKGSLYYDGTRMLTQGIYNAPVIDTTGAGDTYIGYFAAMWAQGSEIQRAMDLASKASSIAVSHPGAAVSIPAMDEVQDTYLDAVSLEDGEIPLL